MADAFVIGGDGVSLFASVGIMMPLASSHEDVRVPLKDSELLRDRLMQDLGLSDAADSDEEEWAPDSTLALKLDEFREPLKDSELQDRLMKDLGLSDSDEEEWVPNTKLAALESEEEEWHFKSQFDSKDSDEEEWIPSSEGEEEEEWRPKSRVDYKESDEEEWVSGSSSDTSESDEEEWAPESQTDHVVRVSLRRRRDTDDRRYTRRLTKEWQSHPVDNSAKSHEPLPVKRIEDHGDDKGCLHQGCGSQPKLNGRCPAHSVKCSKIGCRKVVLREGKCFSHCRLAVCSYPECVNFVRGATMCFKHRDKNAKEARNIPGSKESCVSNVSPVKPLGLLSTTTSLIGSRFTGTQEDIAVTGTGRAIAEASSSEEEEEEEEEEDEADDDGDDDYEDDDEDEEDEDEGKPTEATSATDRKIKAEYNACSHQGCFAVARFNGRCIRHGGGKKCSHPGCTKHAFSNDTCLAHVKTPMRSRQESITRFLTREPSGAQPQSHDRTSEKPVLIIQTGEATGSESSVSSALEECKPQITPVVLDPAMVDSLAEEPKPRMVDQVKISTEVVQPYTVDRLDAASRLLENALVPAKTTTVLTSSNAAAQFSSEPTAYVSRPVCISFAVLDQSRLEMSMVPSSDRTDGFNHSQAPGIAQDPSNVAGQSSCAAPGCSKMPLSGGVCFVHGGGSICAHPMCVKLAQNNGLCVSHEQPTNSLHPYSQLTQEWRAQGRS